MEGVNLMAEVISKNTSLAKAKSAKSDEFYTLLSDVEKEMAHYRDHFEGKVIFLNCDDPEISSFWQYFSLNFDFLGLKGLISTHYVRDIEEDSAYMLRYDAQPGTNIERTTKKMLKGDGDFRSEECIELLNEADIVITNPPFSLWKEYFAQLMDHKKDFIILGNSNSVINKEVFPYFKSNQVWFGVTRDGNGQMWFRVPDEFPDKTGQRYDENGNKYQTVGNTAWYTNLKHKKRNQEFVLTEFYQGAEENYPVYDNYKAIEVVPIVKMPMDYEGVMGVPTSFLSKYNPSQFEILGLDVDVKNGLLGYLKNPLWDSKFDRGYINGNRKFARMLVRNKKPISKKEALGL